MRGIFITGTDTGVGKTVIAAMLTLGWEEAGPAHYWKPIQCGTDPSTDRADVARWTGLAPERLLPEAYRLRMPASPHVAAAAEGVEIERSRLHLPITSGPIIAEGAGGILVPLNARETMLDLMEWLGLPVLLVARTQLGTINHTLLSLAALRLRGVPILGLVLNGAPVASTTATLRTWGGVPLLAEIPPLAELDPIQLRTAVAQGFRLPFEGAHHG